MSITYEKTYIKNQGHIFDKEKQTFSCLSTTFHITKPWIFEKFTIYPSVEVILPAAKISFKFCEKSFLGK